MGSVIAPARVVLAVLLAAAALSWGPRADARTGDVAAAEADRAIFTGRFVSRPELQTDGAIRVRIYRVEVTEVFGPIDIATERIRIRSRFVLESCATPDEEPDRGDPSQQPGSTPSSGVPTGTVTTPPATTPPATTPPATQSPTEPAGDPVDRQLRLFDAVVQGDQYVITSCGDIVLADATVVDQTEAELGPGRPTGIDTEPVIDEFGDVGFRCPETDEALTDLDDQDACEALADHQSFDRAAAPGLALVIVGVLGLVVARRVGRARR